MPTDADPEKLRETIAAVLTEGGYASETEAMRDLSLTIALAKVSTYERECRRFQRKYGRSFEELRDQVERQTGDEDFQVDDDLLDWEFASRALTHWRNRLHVLQNA
ncbi:MAG: hypothetical protein ABEL51_14345 [Salinibacter sp.]